MERKNKLLYVHGFASSGSSGTVMTLRRHLSTWQVVAPDLPVDPFEALELLRRVVEEEKPDVVVGTSMGGMYTQQLWGVPRVIVNPSFEMSRSLLFGKMGRNKYMSKRKDGATEFRIDKAVVERFKQMEKTQFDGITEEEKHLVTALFGDKDPVVNFQALVTELYGAERCILFNGEHRLNDEIVKKVLIPIINGYVKEDEMKY
ncbi:MAG: alpha/beta fold hydrolase [Bacteroidaceae bacterium]|nr:alpha/beta fold hydrolase [Bacteroidaceae bacterium]